MSVKHGEAGRDAKTAPTLIIVSDVDGTLLDSNGRLPWHPAELRSAIARLAARLDRKVTVVLASSRTAAELTVLQRAIGISGPFIAEDGAILGIDHQDIARDNGEPRMTRDCSGVGVVWESRRGRRCILVKSLAHDAAHLRALMGSLPALEGADVSLSGRDSSVAMGFRTSGSVRRALHQRTHSILLDPDRLDMTGFDEIARKARIHSLHFRRGGRWLTLSAAGGKGPAVRALRKFLSVGEASPLFVGIGNEENDESMLNATDLRFVIRNPGRGPLESLASLSGAIVLPSEGPNGWMDMLDHLSKWEL